MAKSLDLEARIVEVRAECEAYIDARANALKANCAGVPLGVLRQLITAKGGGCTCRTYLSAKAEEDKENAIAKAQSA